MSKMNRIEELKCVNCLSCELQSTSFFLPSTMHLVETTKKDLQVSRMQKHNNKFIKSQNYLPKMWII